MCGRFGFDMPPKKAKEAFELSRVEEYTPRRNIAPTTEVAVIVAGGEGRVLGAMRWGLVPSWAKTPEMGARMINARAETAAEKPAFRAAFKRRRCLLPAQWFYEWKRKEKSKQPYAIAMEDRAPFAMAGLWEHWQGADGSELLTVCILTTDANDLVAPIHDRMPVILPKHDWDLWLLAGEQGGDASKLERERLQALLRPYPADAMHAWPVSTEVNNPRNQELSLEPIAEGGV